MKFLTLISIGILSVSALAQDDKEQELLQWQQEFLNLPEDRREEFTKHLSKSGELFNQKRIFETIEEAESARSIFKNSPDLENLLGACQVEFRDFEKAMAHFERANELSPNNPNILFNIAEIHFVTKEWKDSERYLSRVLELSAENKNVLALSRLVEFKLLLCKIKLDEAETARAMAKKYDYLDDSPYPYYAEAAICFMDDDLIGAEKALARAQRIFRAPAVIAPWKDTLMEFGYIKSFYGGDLSEEDQ